MQDQPPEEMRAVGRLPGGLELEIRHRRATGAAGAEQIAVSLTAPQGFEAWARLLEASNPMLAPMQFWARCAEAAWAPWLALMGLAPSRLPGTDRRR
ncbi:hypothetical protein [Roseicella frigidaeris]|uniref:Uncharacterized protein n=1 Tax=Roseicella frigidaeris TaxID=2230885 RepID=A0A327MA64_9PROT|nr:hypothetical protein [Roseicella frigidaeris]RAI59325.1 hypothetical protein DOO78_09880 [Roseicella frigidaeris]